MIWPFGRRRNAQRTGSIGTYRGGIHNPRSGIGGVSDKTVGAYFLPTVWNSRQIPETIYVESWVAEHAVDMPVDDMFIRWREWMDPEMEKAELAYGVRQALGRAMKSARIYGTGVVVMMTTEDSMMAPLVPERIREGDLKALRVFDRYDMSVTVRDLDPWSPNYGKPMYYDIHPWSGNAASLRVHHSRVIRFDELMSPSDRPLFSYSQDWGVSMLVPILASILEDATLINSISHLSMEASIPVLKISKLRDRALGEQGDDEASVDDIGQQINTAKSSYRLMMLDKDQEDFTRVPVSFSALPELVDRFQLRVGAGAKIPQTRFMGRSPAGLNATGDSDMKNYVIMMEAEREKKLRDDLPRMDEVVARSWGIREVPSWHWLSLMELSDQERAQIERIQEQTVGGALAMGVMDEDEARATLQEHVPLFRGLTGPAPEPEIPELDPLSPLNSPSNNPSGM